MHFCELSYISIYMAISIDSHWSISLKLLEGNIILQKTLRMLKIHLITAFMKTYAKLKKMIKVFCFEYIFLIKSKICILDLMLLPKNSVPFEGLYYSNTRRQSCIAVLCSLRNMLPKGAYCVHCIHNLLPWNWGHVWYPHNMLPSWSFLILTQNDVML